MLEGVLEGGDESMLDRGVRGGVRGGCKRGVQEDML